MGTGICPFCGKKVDKFIMFRGDVVGCRYCGIHTKQTNADRIRAMTDEELTEWIADIADCSECEHRYAGEGKPCHNGICCPDYWLGWLREEAKDG